MKKIIPTSVRISLRAKTMTKKNKLRIAAAVSAALLLGGAILWFKDDISQKISDDDMIKMRPVIITQGKLDDITADMLSDTSAVSASPGITAEGLVNINTATLDELKTLNGIGDVIAERIIEYRSSNAFKSKEDVMSVNGIGKAVYEKIKDHIIC